MAKSKETITFEHKGIGSVLANTRLRVPINQRSYAWEEQHVTDLLHDFANAVNSDEPEYFLGTVVLTRSDVPEIADGQQRLATTTILMAAIRDYFFNNGNKARAEALSNDYLCTLDLRTEEPVPRLKLNIEDNDFFTKRILSEPGSKDRKITPAKLSHRRIDKAAQLVAAHIEKVVAAYSDKDRISRLVDWIEFLKEGASVITITVPDYINAYTMFETLNDRGLRVAQSDILKNYLFGKATEARLPELQPRWASMVAAIETVGDDDLTVTYIRHFWITQDGPTKERELSKRIKDKVNSMHKSIEFVASLDEGTSHYVALLNPSHEKWNKYGESTRKHIDIITKQLRVEQIRPLMFAVSRYFSVEEGKKAFRFFVSSSVRILVGGLRGGVFDRNYAVAAQRVGSGEITTASQLRKELEEIVPNDAAFEQAFSGARVSQSYLARYYLRALELQIKQDPEPELVPNEDQEAVNLEHILPVTSGPEWKIEPEMASAYYNRLGNMVILQAKVNVAIGNEKFSVKRGVYKKSAYLITKQVADYSSWGLNQINERQKELAQLAVKTWPLTFGK